LKYSRGYSHENIWCTGRLINCGTRYCYSRTDNASSDSKNPLTCILGECTPSQFLDESVSPSSRIRSYLRRSSTRRRSLSRTTSRSRTTVLTMTGISFCRSWMRNGALEFFLLFSFFPSQWIATTTRKALFIVQRSQRITRLKSVRPRTKGPVLCPLNHGTCWYNFLENHCLTAFMSSNIILFVIT